MARVKFETTGAVGVIALDNPSLNLFSFELIDDLGAAIEAAAAAPIRALLVRAEGKLFSGGADVRIFQGRSAADARRLFARYVPLIARLEELPFPTLAAVQGLCLAAGFELALGCDLIWAAESAQFAQSEALIGTATLLGGAQRIAERAGPARAREIVMTADFYSAATPERWNIINRVVPDEALQAEALRFAQRLAAGPTRAHNVTKRLVRAYLDGGIRAADRLILDVATPLFDSEDMQGGVATLLEYGAREFRGKMTFQGR